MDKPKLGSALLPAVLALSFSAGAAVSAAAPALAAGTSAAPRARPAARPEAPAVRLHYLGHSSFLFLFDNGVSLLIDYGQSRAYGLDSPIHEIGDFRPTLAAYTHHHADHDRGAAFPGATVLDGGELDLKGISIRTVPVTERKPDDNRGFLIRYKGLAFFHAGDVQGLMALPPGDPARAALKERLPDRLDVLLLPVGWVRPITAEAAAFVAFLRPGAVIPMHYWSAEEKRAFLDALKSSGGCLIRELKGPVWESASLVPAPEIQVLSLEAAPFGK